MKKKVVHVASTNVYPAPDITFLCNMGIVLWDELYPKTNIYMRTLLNECNKTSAGGWPDPLKPAKKGGGGYLYQRNTAWSNAVFSG